MRRSAAIVAGCALVGCASRAQLVATLRSDLDRVRTTPAEQSPAVWGTNLRPLEGMSLAEIKAQLGTPDCDSSEDGRCFGDADLVYEYYTVPESQLGGGPNLLIWKDANNRCREARWLGSK